MMHALLAECELFSFRVYYGNDRRFNELLITHSQFPSDFNRGQRPR